VEPGSWYWHRNLVERDREKRLLCERKGIRLITVYDHYDETAVPFDDCLVTPCDLASRRNMDKLVAVTKTLFGAFGLDSNLAAGEWETIRRRAELDSRRMTTEEFRAELAGINDKIEVIGEYTRASDKIRVRCKVCNHEWSVAPTTLRRGSGCASCAGRLKLSHERFVERLNLLHPEIVPLTEYVNSQTRMTFECRACGHVWSAQAYGLIAKSRSSGCRKCSVRAMLRRRSRKVRCITTGEVFDTLREAAAKYGVSRSAISQCCSEPPKLKRAGGREWEYVDLLSGERREGGRWYTKVYDYFSLPVFVRENTVLAMGENDQLPDYEYAENVVLHLFEIKDGAKITTEVTDVSGKTVLVANTKREGNTVSVTVDHPQYHPSVMVHGMPGVAIQTELEVNYTDKGVI
jgi:transcription elongation factor Elf1